MSTPALTRPAPDARRLHPPKRWAAAAATALPLLLCLATGSTLAATDRPWIQGNRSVPYFPLATTVTEVVQVETGFDRDRNNIPDTIRVKVTRPETSPGTRLPLIVHASPYNTPRTAAPWEVGFFVTRGYAVATVDLPGTYLSSGCDDVGGDFEVLGTKAVVDWANGRAVGRYSDGSVADATTWTNGKTGMIGVSWDGTIANALAATGVRGLKTIVPVAAISSWYDYTRGHGVPYFEGHVEFLADYVSNYDSPYCEQLTTKLQTKSDDPTGSYNTWWKERDYRVDASQIKASIFVVHGLNDENVRTGQFGQWWSEISRLAIPRRLFLHQGQHIDPYYSFGATYTTPLLQWFDHYLQGLDNGADTEPQAIVQREDNSWSTDAAWPPEGTTAQTLKLSSPLGRAAAALTTQAITTPGADRQLSFTQSAAYSTDSIVSSPTSLRTDRLVFLSDPLAAPVRLAGTARVKLRVKVDRPTAALQVRLVDYLGNSAYVVTRTIADVGHHESLKQQQALVPGEWYTLSWDQHTDDRIFATGHQLGVVISAEKANPLIDYLPVAVTVDTKRSTVTLPLLGSLSSLGRAGPIAPLVTTRLDAPSPVTTRDEFIREFVHGSR